MEIREYKKMYDHERIYWWFTVRRAFIRTFLSSLSKKKNRKILDAGCGTGGNIPLLRQYGQVTAVDAAPVAITLCKKRGFTSAIQSSIEKLPFGKNSFDCIALFDVLYHKRIYDDKKTLRYLNTFIKPRGYLLVTDCAFQFLYGTHDIHNHARTRYSLSELTAKLRQSGFTIVRSSYIFCFPFAFFIVNRLMTSLGILSASNTEMNIHPVVNTLFKKIGGIEDAVLRRINLPFGSSIIILAQKQ